MCVMFIISLFMFFKRHLDILIFLSNVNDVRTFSLEILLLAHLLHRVTQAY